MSFSVVYAETGSLPRSDAAYFLSKYGHLLQWKNYKEHVMDVGCGEGSVTREILFPFLKNRIEKLEAIDKLESMIKLAKHVNDKREIQFEVMDICNSEYITSKESKIDHLFSFYCAHMVDTRTLLTAFYKMLTPGGQIFVTALSNTPVHWSLNKIKEEGTWDKYLPRQDYLQNYGENPQKFICDILEDVGFKTDLYISEEKFNIVENFPDYVRSLIHLFDALDHLPVELRDEYIKDHTRNICSNGIYLGEPNKYKVWYDAIVFIASKGT